MEDRSRVFALPRGFRDILPTEARELRAIERTLMEAFAAHGYVPLEPPMVEYAGGPLPFAEGRVLEFLDRDGRLVALRPDVTTAVARLVAQRYRDATGALRLAYFAPVFREEPSMLGAEREFDQAGVELVGEPGVLADAEVLALLAEALARVGLHTVTIEVGHVGVVRRLFADLDAEARENVLAELRRGDLVGAFRVARAAGMLMDSLERARRALAARGRGIEAVDVEGVMELRETIHLARELFAGEPLWGVPNLAIVPELPYYTGIVFEVLSPHVGFPIAAGGRYDALLAAFGAPRPATGFAINVPRLHLALFGDGWKPPRQSALVSLVSDGEPRATLRLAAALRRAGLAVALGSVAESAGQPVVRVEVADESHARLADGRVLGAEELARELGP